MTIKFSALVAALFLLLALPGWALAAEVRSGPSAQVAPGETVDDDLFAGGGRTVTIGGHVTGDAYAAGESVIVNGTIDGDLITAAEQVIVDGSVGGNIRAAGSNVTVNGTVGHNVSALAQHLNLTSNSRINGSLVGLGQTIDAFGQIGRGMTVGAGALQLAGSVGGRVQAHVDNLSIAPSARLAGGLEYQAKQEAAVPSGTVSGDVRFEPAPQEQPQRQPPVLNGLLDLSGLIGLVGSFLIGAVAIILMPRASARAAELGRQQPWQSLGLGLVVLIGVPIVAVVVAVTLIGIPLALSILALYTVAIFLAWPAVGLVVGTQLMRMARPDQPLPVLAVLAIGLVVLHLVTHLPIVGPLAIFCAIVFGLGMLAQTVRRWRQSTDFPPSGARVTVAPVAATPAV
jgi:cytoskeletal protein CcmA (bactofilin family)